MRGLERGMTAEGDGWGGRINGFKETFQFPPKYPREPIVSKASLYNFLKFIGK